MLNPAFIILNFSPTKAYKMVFTALAFSHQAGLTFNEIVFTPHAVEAPLEPLRMEHFYLCQYIMSDNYILRLKKINFSSTYTWCWSVPLFIGIFV